MRLRAGAVLLAASLLPGAGSADEPVTRLLEHEGLDQPPGRPASDDMFARTPALRIQFGSYESIQVNVNAQGNNIVGDAANEPSIAVNPLNPSNMVIAWRQFSTIQSNFRQAGWAYTFDAGQHWVFPGVLTPGVFRSDPVVDVDSKGTFYYQSLLGSSAAFAVQVFRSIDGGVTWLPPVDEYGGDKNWFAVDRTGLASDGYLYGFWQRFFSPCCDPNTLTRSIDGGESFQPPAPIAYYPVFGTLSVGPAAQLYAAGLDGTFGQDRTRFVVSVSTDVTDPEAVPSFTGTVVDLGGTLEFGGPNPDGLLGQVNVFASHAGGERQGEVYLLASVNGPRTDPMDVHVARSSDGGATWHAPVRINDDTGNAWQWMAAGAVAPNGRLDAVWFDTRNGPNANIAQLFYAYSWDGGATWSPNVAVTPPFNSSVGYPNQAKMGDYMTLVASDTGADVAFAATFTGGQDVYYVRVFPDCNGNGVSDVTDLGETSSEDCDANRVPDECQAAPGCIGAGAVQGSGLSVARSPGGELTLAWEPSCADGDDYAVYEGALGDFTSHVARVCSTGGETTETVSPYPGDRYYLVVPTRAGREGSYGKGGAEADRAPSLTACFPQLVRACPH